MAARQSELDKVIGRWSRWGITPRMFYDAFETWFREEYPGFFSNGKDFPGLLDPLHTRNTVITDKLLDSPAANHRLRSLPAFYSPQHAIIALSITYSNRLKSAITQGSVDALMALDLSEAFKSHKMLESVISTFQPEHDLPVFIPPPQPDAPPSGRQNFIPPPQPDAVPSGHQNPGAPIRPLEFWPGTSIRQFYEAFQDVYRRRWPEYRVPRSTAKSLHGQSAEELLSGLPRYRPNMVHACQELSDLYVHRVTSDSNLEEKAAILLLVDLQNLRFHCHTVPAPALNADQAVPPLFPLLSQAQNVPPTSEEQLEQSAAPRTKVIPVSESLSSMSLNTYATAPPWQQYRQSSDPRYTIEGGQNRGDSSFAEQQLNKTTGQAQEDLREQRDLQQALMMSAEEQQPALSHESSSKSQMSNQGPPATSSHQQRSQYSDPRNTIGSSGLTVPQPKAVQHQQSPASGYQMPTKHTVRHDDFRSVVGIPTRTTTRPDLSQDDDDSSGNEASDLGHEIFPKGGPSTASRADTLLVGTQAAPRLPALPKRQPGFRPSDTLRQERSSTAQGTHHHPTTARERQLDSQSSTWPAQGNQAGLSQAVEPSFRLPVPRRSGLSDRNILLRDDQPETTDGRTRTPPPQKPLARPGDGSPSSGTSKEGTQKPKQSKQAKKPKR